MRILSFLTLVFALAAVLLTETTEACDFNCQLDVGKAFAQSYHHEVAKSFARFQVSLGNHLLDSVNLRKLSPNNHANLRGTIITAVQAKVEQLRREFVVTLSELMQDAVFNQSPEFRQQCSQSVSVKDGEVVKESEICSSPFSISVHIERVKPRTLRTIVSALDNDAAPDGAYFRGISKIVENVTKSEKLSDKNRKLLMDKVRTNLRRLLEIFNANVRDDFCTSEICDKHIISIKEVLLQL